MGATDSLGLAATTIDAGNFGGTPMLGGGGSLGGSLFGAGVGGRGGSGLGSLAGVLGMAAILTMPSDSATGSTVTQGDSCKPDCDPKACPYPAGEPFNKRTDFSSHIRNTADGSANGRSHGCMQLTGSPVHWHYDKYNQDKKCVCHLQKNIFGGCGVAPP